MLELANAAKARSIFVVGIGRDVGKTTSLRAIYDAACDARTPVGLASCGIAASRKPRLWLAPKTVFATARDALPRTPAVEIVRLSRLRTAGSALLYARVAASGFFELAGPPTASGVREVVDDLGALSEIVVVDGAVDRVAALADTEGAIGPNHYVQWVNLSFAVYARGPVGSTPTLVYGPVAGNTIWTGFGGPCETTNNGDPVVRYDALADRWVMSQLALPNSVFGLYFAPFYQCIAVSATADPTGAYYRYQYSFQNLNDYPKLGVWPDAYYMTMNQFTPPFRLRARYMRRLPLPLLRLRLRKRFQPPPKALFPRARIFNSL